MTTKNFLFLIFSIVLSVNSVTGQNNSNIVVSDSINNLLLSNYNTRLLEVEQQRTADSINRAELKEKLEKLQTTNNIQKDSLLKKLDQIEVQEQQRITLKKQRIDSLKMTVQGYPVIGIYNDTLFLVFSKLGTSQPRERAINISNRIENLYHNDFIKIDSIRFIDSEYTVDIVYGETIIMSILETDALWQDVTKHELAARYTEIIKNDLKSAKEESRLSRVVMRLSLFLMVFISVLLLLWLINKAYKKFILYFEINKSKWLKNLNYKDYTVLSAEQEYKVVLFFFKSMRWIIFALILYIALPIFFRIFPFTRGWSDELFALIWKPFKSIFIAAWKFFPNLYTILAIYLVMKYVIRFVRYIFVEIEAEKLKLSGFHSDWAMPTFSIVKFLLYAFMLILIFPYLPGSGSDIFKGVSVFLGILFSLGSSTAIANIVAGLVLTYMRPFKIGDRIKIGDVFGDVEEKTLLVTRIKTPKNEIVTVPNSTVLSSNTINYSSETVNAGLILHTTVTIGYDVPWKDMHNALIDAALRTEHLLQDPKPFVFQTSLGDFYVSYQINAYTKEVNRQGFLYSNLHQNIQDVCNERGIEILSPHYRAERDGNMTTIPADYLQKDYKAPSFNVQVETKRD